VDVRVIGKLKREVNAIDCRPLRTMRLHARVIIRDGSRAFVGSRACGAGARSAARGRLLISNASVARKMQEVFEQDWTDSANEKRSRSASEISTGKGARSERQGRSSGTDKDRTRARKSA
jgi:phosphatidylserine/phosphatidylglycerophosphate/cardiolipin synthase-like enzyme